MRKLLILVAIAPILAACSSPKNAYYTLSAPAVPAATLMQHKTRIMVGPVTLPTAVDTPQLVVRNSNNQVTVYEYQRWAGSLKADIEKVVAANLARDLSTPNVWGYGQSAYSQPDYQVFVDVQNLDSQLGDSVTIDVLWTIKPAAPKAKPQGADHGKASANNPAVISGRSVVREPVSTNSIEALVSAQSRAFEKVSGEIARAIRPNSHHFRK